MLKITFIGGGNMGEAMISAILRKQITDASSITVSDISAERREYLEKQYGISVTDNNHKAISNVDVVVLAVKPQNLTEVLAGLKGLLKPEQLVLSIVAGARLATICQRLEHHHVIRSMPNMPSQIGQGMTAWTASPEVTEQQRKRAGAILGAMGREIYVSNDDRIDMATAVSGSGPAYLFYFVEALLDSAIQIGLSHDVAIELVITTVLGAGNLVEKSGMEPAELRRMVTSPGGTTAEAIRELEQGKFSPLISKAVRAAYERAKQLGG